MFLHSTLDTNLTCEDGFYEESGSCVRSKMVTAKLSLDIIFIDAYNNKLSPEFKELSTNVESSLQEQMMNSKIEGFKKVSTVYYYYQASKYSSHRWYFESCIHFMNLKAMCLTS